MNLHLEVEDAHFEYLRLQKGSIDDLSDDRRAWHAAYENDLAQQFDNIRPYLPATCWGLLDIGAGLGGIDVLIGRHYAEQRGEGKKGWPYVHLLDGVDDPPEMHLHRETFSNKRVARDFQIKNGLPSERFGYFGPADAWDTRPYDLVVSFGSWCFHYEPAVYLKKLLQPGGLHADSVLILDVRAGKPAWVNELDATFRRLAIIATRPKWMRIVYGRR
jgi:hypothetical protein